MKYCIIDHQKRVQHRWRAPSIVSLETLFISVHYIFILLHYTGISCLSTRIQLSISVRIVFRLLLRSADKVGRPFCFCSVFSFFYYYSFLFFSTATCVSRFLRDFSTNLHEIWQVDSPWWDEQTEYFFKSIGPGVGIRRGPKVLLCFIIGKTLYTVRRDKNFT